MWTGFQGELIFNPNFAIMKCGFSDASQNAPCLPELRFHIQLQNPFGTNAGSTLQAKAVGAGLDFVPISFGPVMNTVLIGAITVQEATLLEVTQISGDAPQSKGLNRLRLQVYFSAPIPAGTLITLSGLTGSLSPSLSCEPVPSPTCANTAHCIFSAADGACQRGLPLSDYALASALSGTWDQATGTIIFAVQPSFQFKRDLNVTFSLLNPGPRQAAPTVLVSASGSGISVEPHPVSSSVFQGGEAYVQPASEIPRITSASAEESNKVETQPNIITIRFASNTQLEEGTVVTLSGLENMHMRPDADGNTQFFVWYGDALERVQSVHVSGDAVVPVAQWQAEAPASQPGSWYCSARDRAWLESEDAYWGMKAGLNWQNEPAMGDWPNQPARVMPQRWCQVQPAHSMFLRLARCFEAGSEISFTMTLPNGMVPKAQANGVALTYIALSGSSIRADPAPVLPVPVIKEWALQCRGLQACTASVEQNENCFDAECRYLAPSAVMTQAFLSVDVACTDFSHMGKFVERIGICVAPTCAPPLAWNRAASKCCDVDTGICEDYLCAESLPAGAFDTGPWEGCAQDCQASRRALQRLDVMPILCSGQTPCIAPATFVVVVGVSTFVEDNACGTSPLDATVTLEYAYTYEKALQATEKGRITFFKAQEDTSTALSLSSITVSFMVSTRIVAGTNVSVSFLLGSSMPDYRQMQIENVECSELELSEVQYLVCSPSPPSQHFFSSTGVWNQKEGTLQVQTVASVPPTRRVSFRFVLQNAAAQQKPSFPRLMLSEGSHVMGPRTSFHALLVSNAAPQIHAEGMVLETSDVQTAHNEITVVFSCNFALPLNSVIDITGLTGSGTADTEQMHVETDLEISQAVWIQETGTLRLTAAQHIRSEEVLQFAFTLVNPIFAQEPRKVNVQVDEPALPDTTGPRLSATLQNAVLGGRTAPSLKLAVLTESDTMAGQWNSIRASFQGNSPLPYGSRIAITGLQGAQNPDELFLPVTVHSAACSPNSVQAFAEWRAEPGTLSFILQCHLPVSTPISVDFMLLNPNTTAPEQSAFIAASGPHVHFPWTPMVNSVLGPTETPAFSIAAVAESSQEPVVEADILMVLQANVDVGQGSVIEISRLLGSSSSVLSSDGAVAIHGSGPLDGTEVRTEWESKWNVALGELELVAGSLIGKGELLRILIHLQNPLLPKDGMIPEVQVKSPPGANQRVLIPQRIMSGSALSARVTGRVLSAFLYETAKVQGSENPIKLEFSVDFNVGAGAQITLTGLLGSLTTDGFVSLRGQDAPLFGNNATWRQDPGQLVLSVAKTEFRWKASGQTMTVEFTVRNPPNGQPLGIQPSVESQWHIAQPFFFPTDIFRAESASFWIKHTIAESCAARSCLNTLSVTLAVDASLPPGTQITISGISGAKNDVGPIPILGPDSAYIKEATWMQKVVSGWDVVGEVYQPATLVMVLQSTFPTYTDLSISFQVTNLDIISGNAEIYVSASGNQTSTDKFELAEARLTGAVLVGSEAAKFLSTIISESSNVPAERSTITISSSASISMFQDTVITIADLVGSKSADDDSLAIRSSDNVMKSVGAWQQEGGFLKVELAADVAAKQPFSFSFEIINPAQAQVEVAPQVWTKDLVRNTLVRPSLKWHMGFQRWRGWLDPAESDGVARSVLGAADSLQWTLLQIIELSNVPSVLNRLELSVMASGIIPAGVTFTVSDLTGSATEDSTAMTISLRIGAGLPATAEARFTRILGTLVFQVPVPVPASTLYSVSFSLLNPAAAQIPVRPKVAMRLSAAAVDLAATPASVVVPCCLSGGGFYYVESATIRESTDVANQQNVLYLTVSTSFPLVLGTVFSVTGLAGSQTPSNAAMTLNGDPLLIAQWDQAGSLVFQVSSEMYVCPTCTDTPETPCQSRRKISISFQLKNAQAKQAAQQVQVVAHDTTGNRYFEPTNVAGGQTVLRAGGTSKVIAQISEGSRTPGTVNLITVTIRANTALDACHTALFKPGVDAQKAWVSDARSLSDCPWRGAAGCFDPAFLFDGLKSTGVQIAMYDPGKPGSGYIGLDLGAAYRIDAFRVTGTRGTSAVGLAQAKRVRLLWADSASPDPAAWHVAGAIDLAFDSGAVESQRFPAVSARYWRLEAPSNHESFNLYKYSNVQELEVYACLDADSTRIIIKNLTGSLTPDNPKMALVNLATESPDSLRPTGIWTQSAGQLEVKVDYLAKAYDEMTFGINLAYPPVSAPQAARAVTIAVSGNVGVPVQIADTPVFGRVLGIASASQGPATVQPAQAAPPAGSTASVSPAPAQDVRVFALATIRGSSKLARADNIITVTLEPQVDLPFDAKVTITGLAGARPLLSSKERLPFKSVEPSGVLSASYSWENSACETSSPTCGRLVATVSAAMWSSGQRLVASFSVANKEAIYSRVTPIKIKVTSSTHSWEQDMCQTMPVGGICKTFPADVLAVEHEPGLLSAVALQSTSTQNQDNLIRVIILPNVQVLSGTKLTISGLLGSATFSTDLLKLHGSSSFLFGFQGSFSRDTGTLVVTAARDLGNSESAPAFEISFALVNAATPQGAQTVSVTMQLPAGVVGTCAREVCDVLPQIGTRPGTLYSIGAFTDTTTVKLLDLVRHLSGNGAPVAKASLARSVLIDPPFLRSSDAAGFITKIISESTDVANHDTVIRVTLSPNFLVRDGSVITIKGLTGSQSLDSSAFPVAISSEGDRLGTWAKETGTLKIALQQTLLARSGIVTLSFVLRNPESAQAAIAAPTVGMVGVVPQPLQGAVLGSAGKLIMFAPVLCLCLSSAHWKILRV